MATLSCPYVFVRLPSPACSDASTICLCRQPLSQFDFYGAEPDLFRLVALIVWPYGLSNSDLISSLESMPFKGHLTGPGKVL